ERPARRTAVLISISSEARDDPTVRPGSQVSEESQSKKPNNQRNQTIKEKQKRDKNISSHLRGLHRRNTPGLSFNPLKLSRRARRYPDVVAMLSCPRLDWTSGSVAPRSMVTRARDAAKRTHWRFDAGTRR